jgi:DNA-binding response OmpR family regulator
MSMQNDVATILLVEDVEEIRDAAAELLMSDGYRVASARDEEDALLRAQQETPNILLVNLPGPYIAVLEIARRIRERAGLSDDVPILIFDVNTIPEGAELQMPENIHLARPDNFDQLRKFIRRLLDQVSFSRLH